MIRSFADTDRNASGIATVAEGYFLTSSNVRCGA